jgi:hypothetical protein
MFRPVFVISSVCHLKMAKRGRNMYCFGYTYIKVASTVYSIFSVVTTQNRMQQLNIFSCYPPHL